MELSLVAISVSALIAVVSALFSRKYYRLKARVKVLSELLVTAAKAVEDDEFTEEELRDIVNLVKKLLGRDGD